MEIKIKRTHPAIKRYYLFLISILILSCNSIDKNSHKFFFREPSPEKYEKSTLHIKGTFDEAMSVFFSKDKKPKDKL